MIALIGWQYSQLVWVAIVSCLVAIAVIVWLYRPQVQPVDPPWSWILIVLRTATLFVLALSLLRPAVKIPVREKERGIIAVLVDQSGSMSAVDSGRPVTELVQIAAALGAVPRDARPAQLGELRQRLTDLTELTKRVARATHEPEYARLSGRAVESAEAHLRESRAALAAAVIPIAADAPQPLAESIAQIGGDSADGQIAQILAQLDTMQDEADEALYRNNSAVRAACDELAAQSRIKLVSRALDDQTGLLDRLATFGPVRAYGFAGRLALLDRPIGDLSAAGTSTDLAGEIRELRRIASPQQVAAVVLFSDGRQAGGEARALSEWQNIPIIAVNPGLTAPRDVSIDRVSAPPSAFIDETITVRADIRATGFDGTEAVVTVNSGLQSQARRVTLSGETVRAEVEMKVGQPGPCELRVTVAPIAGEATTANNEVRRMIKISEDRSSILLIGGHESRDFQDLRSILSRAPGVKVTEQLLTGGSTIPASELLEQDVVVLSDVPTAALDARQWDALVRLVSERGGSVIIIASDPSIPGAYASHPLAASLLPWRGDTQPAWRVWPGEDPVFRVVPVGPDSDSMKLSNDTDTRRARWTHLPPIFRFLLLPNLRPGTRIVLAERDSGLPVLTEMKVGDGRAFFLGTNEAWRWRATGTDQNDDQFWLRLIHHAAKEPYAVSSGSLSLDIAELRVQPGDAIRIRAQARGAASTNSSLQIERDGAVVRTLANSARSPSIDHFEHQIGDLPVGEYVARLVAGDNNVMLNFQVAHTDEAEMRDISANPAELQNLVGSQGDVISLSDLDRLPQRLERLRKSDPQFVQLSLWDSPYLFMFVLGCLGFEWAVRKSVGLT